MSAPAIALDHGLYGGHLVTDTSPRTPPAGYYYHNIQVVGTVDAVFASLTGNVASGSGLPSYSNTISNLTLPLGSAIAGRYTSLTLTSGAVIAYLAKDVTV